MDYEHNSLHKEYYLNRNKNKQLYGNTETTAATTALYYFAFGLFQLLAGTVQSGVILGWTVISSIFLYSFLNFLVGRSR